MKAYTLMCNRTGNILEGRRICFIDRDDEWNSTVHSMGIPAPYQVALVECHGWVVTNPEPDTGFGGCWIYMDAEWVAGNFEVLGEI